MDKAQQNKITRLEKWGLHHIERYIDSDSTLFSRNTPNQATRKAIWISFAIGFVITMAIVAVDILFFSHLSFSDYSFKQWLSIVLLNLILVGIEFWLLFLIGFQVVALYINTLSNRAIDEVSIKASLVRAVLEVGEPVSERFGNEMFQHRKKHYWLRLAIYKLKVVLTNFLAKFLARKILGRVGFRSLAPLISTLVVGFWDAWVQKTVLRQVRFRISSRLFVVEYVALLKKQLPGRNYLESLIRFIAIRILMLEKHDVNLTYLILEIEKTFYIDENEYSDLYDLDLFKQFYLRLSDPEKNHFSELACGLLSFKHKHYSSEEKHLIQFLNINPVRIKDKQSYFDRLCLD